MHSHYTYVCRLSSFENRTLKNHVTGMYYVGGIQ